MKQKHWIVTWLSNALAIVTLTIATALVSILIPLQLLSVPMPKIQFRFNHLAAFAKVLGITCLIVGALTLGPSVVVLSIPIVIVVWLLGQVKKVLSAIVKPIATTWKRWLQKHARMAARVICLSANMLLLAIAAFFLSGIAVGRGVWVMWMLAAIGIVLPSLGGLFILWNDVSTNWAFSHAQLAEVEGLDYQRTWHEISSDICSVSLLYVVDGLSGVLSSLALLVYTHFYYNNPVGAAIVYAIVSFIADGVTFSVNSRLYAKPIPPEELRFQEIQERSPGFLVNAWRAVKLVSSIALIAGAMYVFVNILLSAFIDLGSGFPGSSLIVEYRLTFGLALLATTDNWVIYLVNFIARRKKWPQNFYAWCAWAGPAQLSFWFGLSANAVAYLTADRVLMWYVSLHPLASPTVQALVLALARLLIRQWLSPAWTAYAAQEGKRRNYQAGFRMWRKVMSNVK